jgi:hypothetical protein
MTNEGLSGNSVYSSGTLLIACGGTSAPGSEAWRMLQTNRADPQSSAKLVAVDMKTSG